MVRGVRMRFVGGGGGDCGEVGARLEEVTFVPALFACCFEGGARGRGSPSRGGFEREGRVLRLRLVSASRTPNSSRDDRDFG